VGDKNYERDEQAKWAKVVEDQAQAYLKAVDDGLDKDASRGLCAPAGDTMNMVLTVAHEARGKIVDGLGEIYQKQNERVIQMDEVDTKLMIAGAKLEMEYVKAQLVNLLELETAQMEANVSMSKSEIERRSLEIEKRQAALIMAKAEIEHQVNIYKKKAIEAEGLTLEGEEVLARAQLATEIEKLKIIDALYEQIAAEELVVVAERRKAASLQLVIEAEHRLIAVKQDMIPLLMDKAEARTEQAVAITDESGWNKKIVELGYTKNALVLSQETAEESIREAENDYHTAQLAYTRAAEATNIMRHYSQLKMKENSTAIKHDAIDSGLVLDERKVDLHLGKEVWQLAKEYKINFQERLSHLREVALVTQDSYDTQRAEAYKVHKEFTWHTWGRKIAKGSVGGFSGGEGTFGRGGGGMPILPEIASEVGDL
jgi:hypothetical protein